MTKKRAARILALVKQQTETQIKEYVDGLIKTDTGQPLPIGYNPLERIRGGLFHWVMVPFNGHYYPCQLRCLNATQLEQCGDISNIVLGEGRKQTYEEMLQMRNYQEELCKAVLNIPTFDKIFSLVGENDMVISGWREELENVKKHYEENEAALSETEKETLQLKMKTLELKAGFILPTDTMNFLTMWAMGNDVSSIKQLGKENFLRAASLAKAHNKAPSEYLSGVFTDFNKHEIDTYAFMILDEHMKEREIVESGGGKFRWFGGGRKNKGAALPERPVRK